MKIRKTFKWEGAHIVRDCTSRRCSRSIHGHSYTCEVILIGGLDAGGMVYDFGLMKGVIHDLLDAFDHAITLWSGDKPEYNDDMRKWSERWVMLPVNPSAEQYACMIGAAIQQILDQTDFGNGACPSLAGIKVHETRTGCAHAIPGDWCNDKKTYDPRKIMFSPRVLEEMSNPQQLLAIFRGDARIEDPEEV